jgi:hypothetical protein
MPHIIIGAYHKDKCLQKLFIHAEVDFKKEYFTTPKAQKKLKELQEKLEKVVEEYFEGGYESETYSNYEIKYSISYRQ